MWRDEEDFKSIIKLTVCRLFKSFCHKFCLHFIFDKKIEYYKDKLCFSI